MPVHSNSSVHNENTKLNSVGEITGEFGYGFDAWNGFGTIIPFTGMNYSDDAYNHFYLGTQVEFDSDAKFELKSVKETSDSGKISRTIQLSGKFKW